MMKKRDTFFKRLIYAALPCFLLAFMYTFYLPVEAVTMNAAFISFTWHDLLVELLTVFLGSAVLLTLVVSLFRGKLFDGITLGVTGLVIASYVQLMFLNPDFGVLDGTVINWTVYTGEALLNLLIWAGIFVALFVLRRLMSREGCRAFVMFACAVIVAMQGSGLVVLMMDSEPIEHRYLSSDNRMTVSANDNVILFLPDGISNELFEEVIEAYPDIAEDLKDFTYYNNANCDTRTTFPAMPAWLTSQVYDGSESVSSFYERIWTDETTLDFYRTLKDMNYVVNIYAKQNILTDNIAHLVPIADNIAERTHPEPDLQELPNLYRLSAFRCLPLMMKATMWVSTDDIQDVCNTFGTNWIKVDHRFVNEFRASEMTTDPDHNYYIVQYMKGAHSPYQTDENAVYVEAGTTQVEQTAGYLRLIIEYMDWMKKLGVYDNATLILSTDHGESSKLQMAYLIKKPNEVHDSMIVTNAPISPQREHLATVLTLLGKEGVGASIFDYSENQVVVRTCMYPVQDDNYPTVKKSGVDADGSTNVMYLIEYEGDRNTLKELYKIPTEILPKVDSYF